MRIVGIGAGPGNLYFGILMKKAFPDVEITLYERNAPGATFGWGVVFSDETLGHFETADAPSYAAITREFAYWTDIDTWHKDVMVRTTGHGFCGMSRKRLLEIFHDRAVELGVEVVYDHEVTDFEALRQERDLMLGGDGVHSAVRDLYADTFQPSVDWRKCKFTWLGTTLPLEAFTFIFRENDDGLFQVHAYPFEKDLSTFIVECHEDVWKKAGFDTASEEETVRYMEDLFADHLKGHKVLSNMSIWRTFPTIRNEQWHHENAVLLGDAVHTAHFSIGSGTKLAMEDAIALVEALRETGLDDIPGALRLYQSSRRLDEIKLQKAAQTSLEWFENCSMYMEQTPLAFTFNLMTRSKRVTYDNLILRDPEFVEKVTEEYADDHGWPDDEPAPPPLFVPFSVRGTELINRSVVSPMCQYSAVDGTPNDWHLVHLGALAVGGAGLLFTEMTNVSAEGRITHGCAGMYTDEHEAAWTKVVEFVHANSDTKIAMQLGHAGRKGSCNLPWEGDDPLTDGNAWETLGPSATPFDADWHTPQEMSRADMDRVIGEYFQAAERCGRAGFDVLEIHMAHGYLLSSFISPLSNTRTDEYGGSLENRARFPLEVFDAVRIAWPDKPLFVRVSATDWLDDDGGLTLDETVEFAAMLKAHGCDVIDVSSAGNVPHSQPIYGRMYQVPFAEEIRYKVRIPVMTVGAVLGADHANTILAAGRADLCAMARPHLINPHLTMQAAGRYYADQQPWPKQYLPARPARKDDPPSLVDKMKRRGPRIRHAET